MIPRRTFAVIMLFALPACEGSPTLPAQVQAAAQASPGGAQQATPCPAPRPSRSNGRPYSAAWKKRLDRLARGHSVSIAVGVGGEVVYEHGARLKRTPASNQKLLLSMALFDQLGTHFRIPTTAAARHTRNGTVRGPLWIIGTGDPSLTLKEAHFWGDLTSPTLELLARRIKAAGITRVEGGVRVRTCSCISRPSRPRVISL